MAYEIDEDILEHFGTKGMKWGVRKDTRKPGRASKKTRAKAGLTLVGVAAVAAGAVYATSVLRSSGSNRLQSPSTLPFRAVGRDWSISANDGHTFDIMVRALADRNRR